MSYDRMFMALLFVISTIALIIGSVALSRNDKSKFIDIRSGKSTNLNTKICHILSDDCTKDYASYCDGNVATCYHVKEEANNSQSSSLHGGLSQYMYLEAQNSQFMPWGVMPN